ncbi:MAG: DedA family protein [Actinomycetia bacterium]|nr:DedA family protein [Actinomycetes bacterium]
MVTASVITDVVTGLIGDAGIYAIFALMLLDAVFPAASELVMVFGGALAAGALAGSDVVLFGWHIESPTSAFVAIALAGSIGYWLGAILGWWIGLWGGRPFLVRYGRYLHLGPERLARADRWFERRGDWAVFLGRVLPVVRSFVSIPAGAMRLRFWPYTWSTLLGSSLWAFAFTGIGFAVGSRWQAFHGSFRYADIAVVAAIGLAVGFVAVRYALRRRRAALAQDTGAAG